MSADHDSGLAKALFDVAGGETLAEPTVPGPAFSFTGLPIPDGSVCVLLGLANPEGMAGLRVIVTADQARRMGELLLRVAAR